MEKLPFSITTLTEIIFNENGNGKRNGVYAAKTETSSKVMQQRSLLSSLRVQPLLLKQRKKKNSDNNINITINNNNNENNDNDNDDEDEDGEKN